MFCEGSLRLRNKRRLRSGKSVPFVPAKAGSISGIVDTSRWVPAYARMNGLKANDIPFRSSPRKRGPVLGILEELLDFTLHGNESSLVELH